MSAALDSRDRRAVEHLLAHCAALSAKAQPQPARPVFERLRDRIGAELARRLLSALAGVHRIRRSA